MAFDGVITKSVIAEIEPLLTDGRVEKIYLPNKNEIILSMHKNRESYKLLFSIDASNARFHLTNNQKENPVKPLQFCMVLRKHIQGAKLLNIKQYGLDRIIEFCFEGIDELGDITKKSLFVELMGKYSNIILVNNNNKIIDSIRHVDSTMSSIREVLPAREYILPTSLDRSTFIGMDYDQFIATLQVAMMTPTSSSPNYASLISNQFIGFSKSLIDELLSVCDVNDSFTTENTKKMYMKLMLLLTNCEQHQIKLVSAGKDYHIDLNEFISFDDNCYISNFLDEFYTSKENSANLFNYKQSLQKEISTHKSKYDKNLKRVMAILDEADNMEMYKQYGELISSNIYRMETGLKEITLENFYDNNNLITIPLNESYSPSRNAQSYFKKYSKLKNSIAYAELQRKDYEANIDYLEELSYQISECESKNDLDEIKSELIGAGYIKASSSTKKKVSEIHSMPYRYEMNGIEILVGKNNIQNEKLTLKDSKKTHTWLHTKNVHGSHVIIKSDDVPNEVLLYAATLAVKHSQAKDSSKVEVDYTLVKNVHKLSGGKPGRVTYMNYKTIII